MEKKTRRKKQNIWIAIIILILVGAFRLIVTKDNPKIIIDDTIKMFMQDDTVNNTKKNNTTKNNNKNNDELENINSYDDNVKIPVEYVRTVDGDTIVAKLDGQEIKIRMLYIDTPESTKTVEPYGKEASNYTKNKMEKAKKIEIEFDGDKTDRYDRTLCWVFVDGKLYQEEITKKGLVEKFYDYGTYKYEQECINALENAKENKRKLWQ